MAFSWNSRRPAIPSPGALLLPSHLPAGSESLGGFAPHDVPGCLLACGQTVEITGVSQLQATKAARFGGIDRWSQVNLANLLRSDTPTRVSRVSQCGMPFVDQ
jgi:hypothetical protein